ncbi:hypothetical protein KSP40_PGU000492 [Platanthera guangdongensis]|uniref:Secreted protein n=1 Tax=Platanthera guangdongensis TaxID=2320717 RepID=A0ABR2M759_9ASPA
MLIDCLFFINTGSFVTACYGDQKETNKTPRQQPASLLCNKGSACKFKLSFFGEDDAISSDILLLACVVCSTSSM